MKENTVQQKSFDFAVRIVNLFKFLQQTKREFILSKQLLRSGTSIGANIEEGIGGQSKKDFIAKFQISLKEARETQYWLRLLVATAYLNQKEADSLLEDCREIIAMLTAILKSTKNNLK